MCGVCGTGWLTVLVVCVCVIVTLQGDTPAVIAAYEGHTDGLKLLIEAGANIEAKDNFVCACWCVVCGTGWLTVLAACVLCDCDSAGTYSSHVGCYVWPNSCPQGADRGRRRH